MVAAQRRAAGRAWDEHAGAQPRLRRGDDDAALTAAVLPLTCADGLVGAICVALTVKPFPLAHTLMRQVVKRVTETGSVPERPVAVEVEDVVAHLQDPRKPSRDVLLLLAAASRGSAAGGGGGGGSAPLLPPTSSRDRPGHAGGLPFRIAAVLAGGGGGSSGDSAPAYSAAPPGELGTGLLMFSLDSAGYPAAAAAATAGDAAAPAAAVLPLTCAEGLVGAICVALTVKPFPLAHTLMRQVVKRVTETGSVPERPVAVEVEDVVAHLQDPRKPSRDVLLLLAAASRGSAAGGGGGGGSAPLLPPTSSRDRPGHAGGLPFRIAAVLAGGGGGSSGDSVGPASGGHASCCCGGARGGASVVLVLLPAGDGRGLFGLYTIFPQQLPPLLRAVRSCLLELGLVAAPLVRRKLLGELVEELKTLSTGTPGSYMDPAALLVLAVTMEAIVLVE
ncbi:hypothetical protein GPECTOR_27g670 [Gonium pectorale]|uniref:Uncharacterized protein n=1 Tax=Gonium pectorale TaxID=33097 RepID=A0A150GGL5_GONPE|nr:hypothetical protein GPECTOR_27g670 [Gonium pectorale]|eukprot:KXZ48500.1 hypothetical protein GPECTOR_27g670 [Gonium pectorale]